MIFCLALHDVTTFNLQFRSKEVKEDKPEEEQKQKKEKVKLTPE
jgi:hypothetical protein